MNRKRVWLTAAILVPVILLVAGYSWINRGYGEVSPQAYQFSKAVYSACLNQNDEHLDKIANLMGGDEGAELSDTERRWLADMIARAESGDWKSAARKARRMMEDQVEY